MTGLLGRLAARATGQSPGGPPTLRAAFPPRFAPPEGLGGGMAFGVEVTAETEAPDVAGSATAGGETGHDAVPSPSPERSGGAPRERPVQTAGTVVMSDRAQRAEPGGDHRAMSPERVNPAAPNKDMPRAGTAQSRRDRLSGDAAARAGQPLQPSSPERDTVPPDAFPTGTAESHADAIKPVDTATPEAALTPRTEQGTAASNRLTNSESERTASPSTAQPPGVPAFRQEPTAPNQTPHAEPLPPPGLTIGRIEVTFEAPAPQPSVPRRKAPERTRGFEKYARARLGQRG
ncbi:hypothetical protein [uncultured Salipiger sp.]|uniref:hypothetical protein n=1 Tax=uncultured Salipiger sp. TaxID=499810 RepID=UPI002592BF82|nr:hypothetical protein [uncultured Salipiger sp.]